MIFEKVKKQIKHSYINSNSQFDLLPSERAIAQEFSVSRPTVRKALASLENEGLIKKNEGRGYLINPDHEKYTDHELDSFIGFFQDAVQQGKKISSKIIQQSIVPADELIAKNLSLKTGELIFILERIRFIDDKATCIAKSCIPLYIYPEIVEKDFVNESLFSVLEGQGISLVKAQRSIEVSPANELDRLYLELAENEPVFIFNSVGFTKENKPFEFEISRYPAYKTKFVSTVNQETKFN